MALPAARTIVVVPCFNEAQRLAPASFLEFARTHDDIGFIFVDDGSTDGTSQVLDKLVRELPEQSDVIRLDRNHGKGEAVRRGMCQAFSLTRDPDQVGYWDADLATPLSEIPRFVALLDSRPRVQLVMGARVRLLGRQIKRNPSRHYLGRVFATAVALVLEIDVYDTQCGAKLLRMSRETQRLFALPFLTRWLFDVELLARLKREHQTRGMWDPDECIYEYPVTQWTDIAGSKITTLDFFRATTQLGRIRRYYSRPRS